MNPLRETPRPLFVKGDKLLRDRALSDATCIVKNIGWTDFGWARFDRTIVTLHAAQTLSGLLFHFFLALLINNTHMCPHARDSDCERRCDEAVAERSPTVSKSKASDTTIPNRYILKRQISGISFSGINSYDPRSGAYHLEVHG